MRSGINARSLMINASVGLRGYEGASVRVCVRKSGCASGGM